MNRFCTAWCAAVFFCGGVAFAQAPDAERQVQLQDLPAWLLKFSNLTQEEKSTYIQTFQEAKADYVRGEWVSCEMRLNSCELIFPDNPNIWNLRCSVLIELGRADEAAAELERARAELPRDSVTLLNIANLHMLRKEYETGIAHIAELLETIPYAEEELRDSLTFRSFLCYLLLGQESAARELVKDKGPMDDTPLYYYSQAALHLLKGDRKAATADITTASRIFAKLGTTITYQRALNLSGLVEKAAAL